MQDHLVTDLRKIWRDTNHRHYLEARRKLEALGFKRLGNGSFREVWIHTSTQRVFKIAQNSDGAKDNRFEYYRYRKVFRSEDKPCFAKARNVWDNGEILEVKLAKGQLAHEWPYPVQEAVMAMFIYPLQKEYGLTDMHSANFFIYREHAKIGIMITDYACAVKGDLINAKHRVNSQIQDGSTRTKVYPKSSTQWSEDFSSEPAKRSDRNWRYSGLSPLRSFN